MVNNKEKIINNLMEPMKYYDELKRSFFENINNFFDNLIEESNIDKEKNSILSKEYEDILNEKNDAIKKLDSIETIIFFLSLSGFISLAISVILLIYFDDLEIEYKILFPIFVMISFFSFSCKKHKYEVEKEEIEKIKEDLEKKCYNKLNECHETMQDLNKLMDSSYIIELINESIPFIKLDSYFDIGRFQELYYNYGFQNNDDISSSVLEAISGDILGNPFVVLKEKIRKFTNYTYTGTKYITWTERVTDSEGKTKIVTRSETLYAYVKKPKPIYDTNVTFVFGNNAVENLYFYRKPSHIEKLSENQIKAKVKRDIKKLNRMEKFAVENDESDFVSLANSEFEVLFNALNRNDEREFRMLFTPLAQKNILDLLKNKKYGDNFSYIKSRKLNIINAEHMHNWDLDLNFQKFTNYSYKKAKINFINYTLDYFEKLFFTILPIISIPLFQQTKGEEYIYNEKGKEEYNNYFGEILANSFGTYFFSHDRTRTDEILKAYFIGNNMFEIVSHTYSEKEMVDYVTVWGGDGRFHDVPVYWTLYEPLTKKSRINAKYLGEKDQEVFQKLGEETYDEYESAYTYKNKVLSKVVKNKNGGRRYGKSIR